MISSNEDEIPVDITLEILVQYMINLAKRDYFDGKGRVFIDDLKRLGFKEKEIKEAINRLKNKHNVKVYENLILIFFK